MCKGLENFNMSDNAKELGCASLLIHTALRLLASCAYGMNASGDMSKKASASIVTEALALSNEYAPELDLLDFTGSIGIQSDLRKVEQWFNNYRCPKCGYDKDQRMDKIS